MARFSYRAATPAGDVKNGALDARDKAAAAAHVQALGLVPIHIQPESEATYSTRTGMRMFARRRVNQQLLGALTRELATLLRSGLPLDRAMEILIGMAQTQALAAMLMAIRDEVRGGTTLSQALEVHPDVFGQFYVGMIRAGEAGGALGPALERIAEFMERSKELRETVTSSLIYPTILVFASITSILLLLIFVVPQFSQMFEQSGKALPLPTQIVIGVGEGLRDYWWTLPLGLLLVYRYFVWQMKKPERKLVWDGRLLRLRWVGDLLAKIEVARFARTLGTLLTNGLPLLQALGIVKETVSNNAIAASLGTVREQLKAGQGLSKPLLFQDVFPPLAVQMIGVGEETGRLGDMLFRIADIYDREVSIAVKRMLVLLEPVLILGLGLLIGGIILSILLAILKINNLVG